MDLYLAMTSSGLDENPHHPWGPCGEHIRKHSLCRLEPADTPQDFDDRQTMPETPDSRPKRPPPVISQHGGMQQV